MADGPGATTSVAPEPKNGTALLQGQVPGPAFAEEPLKGRRIPAGARQALIVVAAIVLIALIIWFVRFVSYATTHEQTDDAIVDANFITVTSKISERIAHIYVDTNQHVKKGTLLVALDDAYERTKLAQAQAAYRAQSAQANAAEANVALTRATVQAQTAQSAGSVAQAQAGINSSQAGVESAQKQLAVLQSAVGSAESSLHAAQANVPSAREGLNRARADYDRTASLVNSGDVARAQLDAARAALAAAQSQYQAAIDQVQVAQSNVTQAQARVVAAGAGVSQAQAMVGASQGTLASAQGKLAEADSPYRLGAQEAGAYATQAAMGSIAAQLREAQDQLSYTRIYAAAGGYIGQKNVEVGQVVAPNDALLTIVPLSNVYITANYKETQIGQMKPGQPVDFGVDAYKGTLFHGHVESIGPAANSKYALVPAQNATSNFVKVTQRVPVRISIDKSNDPNKPLRPGMSVETAVQIK